MIIAIDVGNTTVSVACIKGKKVRFVRNIETALPKDEFQSKLNVLFRGSFNPNFAFQANEMQNLPSVVTKGHEVNLVAHKKLSATTRRADFAIAKSGV